MDRVPDELWMGVHDIVQEAVTKIIPKEKKCKKAKWLPEEALQIEEKRREAKGKGEKERFIHLKVEFQRIAKREKKVFLRGQCKEIEENIRHLTECRIFYLVNLGVGKWVHHTESLK